MDVGYMDPYQINQISVKGFEMESFDNILKFLDKQHTKSTILLPYNFG